MTELKMVYSLMEEMAATFSKSAQTLDNLSSNMSNIASKLEGGSLLGKGGDLFVSALRDHFLKQIATLRDKMNEENGDIMVAMGDMVQEDGKASTGFQNL